MAEFRPGTPDQDGVPRGAARQPVCWSRAASPASTGAATTSSGCAGRSTRWSPRPRRRRTRSAWPSRRCCRAAQLEQVGYLKSFPHLAGSIFAFEGDEEQAAEQERRAGRHEDWSEHPGDDRPGADPGRLLPGLPGDRRARRAGRRRGSPSTPAAPTSSATSPPATRRGCRCSTSARSCGSASRRRSPSGAMPGAIARSSCCARSASTRASTSPPTPSSAAAAGCSPAASASRS